jgi:hypothetical protein
MKTTALSIGTLGLTLALTLVVPASVATAQTWQYLNAPVVRSRIRVRWDSTLKAMQWARDNDDTFRGFPTDALFLTKSSIYVVYPHLNPLTTQATATSVAAPDPAYTALTKLLDAFSGFLGAGLPGFPPPPGAAGQKAAKPTPSECTDFAHDRDILLTYINDTKITPASVKASVVKWPGTIDTNFGAGLSGPAAIAPVIDDIGTLATTFQQDIDAAKPFIDSIKACAVKLKTIAASATGKRTLATTAAQKAADTKKKVTATPPGATIDQYVMDHDDATQKDLDASAAEKAEKLWSRYLELSLIDFTPWIQRMTAVETGLNDLADSLTKQYGNLDKWKGPNHADYIISPEIIPTLAVMQTVTVKVVNLTLKVDPITAAISIDQQPAGSTTFNVRTYSTLTTEIGVGVAFSWIKQPSYGTGMNTAGQMIVAKKADKALSTNGAVIANFVCRCGTGLLVPMVQVGANASKDLPAILIGGGFRLFGLGKGDFAIGGGIMAAWFKDLQKLKVGDVITGTNDINSDMGFISRPKFGPYFVVQYKF